MSYWGIFYTNISFPITALFLELGIVPIKNLIQSRPIMYLKEILSENMNSLTRKIYDTQSKQPVKGDWSITVWNDLKEYDFTIEEIVNIKRNKLKKIVNKKMKEKAFLELMKN